MVNLSYSNSQNFDIPFVQNKLRNSVSQLSSGKRFTQAKDDVASMSISNGLNNYIRSSQSVRQNITQAASLLQVAEGGLQQISEILLRMNTLASQGQSDGLTETDKGFLNIELEQLKEQIESIAQNTNFNGIPVLNGRNTNFAAIDGTDLPESILGGAFDESITALGGDDIISAGAGNDTINAGVLRSPGLVGSVYNSPVGINSLAQAENVVATQPVLSTFVASAIDYPNGAANIGGGNIGAFLGADAASLANPGAAGAGMNRKVFVFEGEIDIPVDGNYNFSVGSDDGFNLQINGATVIERTTNRAFATTNGNTNLTAGTHAIRLLYWENSGGNGVEFTSSLTGGAIVDDTVLFSPAVPGSVDGNDTIDGGSGYDTISFTGASSDYTITQLSNGRFEITDNRPGSPDGTDQFENVEFLQFTDGGILLNVLNTPDIDDITFDVSALGSEVIQYDVVDATLDSIFDNPQDVNVKSFESSRTAKSAIEEASNRIISMRAYVGSQAQRVDIIGEKVTSDLFGQTTANAALSETDVTRTSTEFIAQQISLNAGIAVTAQANNLKSDVLTSLLNDTFSQLAPAEG
jgi:flagellin